ncbi:zinc-dependent peptidase [Usitatibacter palustris]|uniref:Protein MtfA n=1 Tax=Usitatibacter palustris TaxID=2732487 RepID=A0A6M4H7I5_9PROT|nr:M90 family metallopeptidase [Usitatibacter palustris]QJR15520.1 Protein MtfA [Usitatibacter palustris]
MLGWLRRRDPDRIASIDPDLWRRASAPWLFMRGLTPAERERLRALSEAFLANKHFSGTHDLEVTPAMQVAIAAQACILVLELGIEWYDGWSEVIVYPSQFAPEREEMDEDGVVHLTRDPMAGEAWLGGPVILSYEDVAMAGDEEVRVAGYNVVIHEFAHKLDMRQGDPNGFPPLHAGMAVAAWRKAFSAAYDDFCARVDEADALAEEDDGEALDTLPIDPYASENPAEFFAVISEAFFETPELLAPEYPAVYEQLRLFYRQDPLARLHCEQSISKGSSSSPSSS